MDEPSVLDYVKSKLAFWKPSSIHIPQPKPPENPAVQRIPGPASPFTGEPSAQFMTELGETRLSTTATEGDASSLAVDGRILLDDSAVPEEIDATRAGEYPYPQAAPVEKASVSAGGLLVTFGALLSALVAQSFLEPPNRAPEAALLFYALAAVLIGFAYFRKFIVPSSTVFEDTRKDSYFYRWEGLAIGLVLLLVAFFAFASKDNQIAEFNFFNTAIWLLSIGYLCWSFYLPGPRVGPTLVQRLTRLLAQPAWRVTLTRGALLALAVTAVILFFRFYRLDSVPGEMFSDHAEKLLDVYDVLNGDTRIFFPRNTGREFFQFYWTALMVKLFPVGISFMALKLGTTLVGLWTLYYIYRLGSEIGGRRVAVLAVLFAGFSYWAVIQSRIGLRFPLYPGFLAPVLYHIIRGLRTTNRNDFIWAGLWLGMGLHGYTSYRIVPIVVVVIFALYMLHNRAAEKTRFALLGLLIVVLISLAVFLPLLRFTMDFPDMVVLRSMSRLSDREQPIPGSPLAIFLQNNWKALTMFFWQDGDVWVHSIPHRPALDVISAALFFLGLILVVLRYLQKRTWIDLTLVVIIPLLLLSSTLSLAFPNENPNLNRTAGAYVPVFIILGLGLDALLSIFKRSLGGRLGAWASTALALVLLFFSASNNYDLVFNQYATSFRASAWNTSEMGAVIREFDATFGGGETNAWVVAFPYWVDTRLVGMNAGYPTRDTAINPQQFADTAGDPRAKLFMINPQDDSGLIALRQVYPEGRYWMHDSDIEGKDFIIFFVQPAADLLPVTPTGPG